MEELTLRPHSEDQPRTLECTLLEPGENAERPLTPDELQELFNMEGVEEEEDLFADVMDFEDHQQEEDDPALIEAQNLVPVRAQDADDGRDEVAMAGDGCCGDESLFDDKAAMDKHIELLQPVVPPEMMDGEDPSEFADGMFSDGEILEYEAQSIYALPPRDDAVYSSSAASSSTPAAADAGVSKVGLNVTPLDVRSKVPPGSKIQHKRAMSSELASGWQAWPFGGAPSRYFSYGTSTARYSTFDEALSAAIEYCWAWSSK